MAGGQQINSGQGTITYEGAGATDALTGSAATTDSGSTAQGTSIRLRSRKVGGGAAAFLLTGQFASVQQETPVKQVSALLATPAVSGAQGAFAKSRSSALTGILIQVLQTSIGPQSGTWDINTVNFTQGTSGSSQLPVPSGYTVGGFFQLVTGFLPSGVTLSDSGLLSYNGSGAAASSSVTFSYTEPGALPTLTLHSTSADTFPYMATIYPAEGAVPSGQILLSPDDSTFRSTVLSTWPDGSAQVMVGAGRKAVAASSTTTVRMRPGSSSGTNLTTTNIASVFTSGITVNFGTSLNLNTWSSPDRIWWQNPEVICARYRLPITNKGVMEAVIDVHAFADGRAFVEVVVENGKFNANAGFQSAPSPQSYTGATVSVNGSTIATVNSSSSPSGSHQGFRAWYCSTWVGGDPGIEVTHDTTYLQAHPLFLRVDKATDQNLQTLYQSDSYTPWSTGRQRAVNMGGGGDHASIGYMTQWDTRYIQSGDKYVRRAVLASALAVLTYNVNYRHTGTGTSNGLVPTFDQSNGYQHSGGGGWPATSNGDVADWEVAHHPAEGLVAFLCRPSPCFIEIAQKIAHWNGTWSNGINGATANGTFGYWYQVRGKAWGVRSLGHAIFLTPDGHPWKTPARDCLTRNVNGLLGYRDSAKNKLDTTWGGDPAAPWDDNAGGTFQNSTFMSFYFVQCMHHIANAKVLLGSEQTNMVALADWSAKFPVRYCNESPGGAFRSMPQRWTIGATGGPNFTTVAMDQYNDWNEMVTTTISGTLPAVSGPWRSEGNNGDSWSNFIDDNTAGAYYPSYYWAALCCAVERDISGASAAWAKVTGGNITNLATWRNGFASEPRWGYYPRNA